MRQWTIEIVQQIKEGGGGAAAILSPSRGGNAPRNLIGNEKTMLALLFSLFPQQRLLDCLVSISRSSWLHAPRWTRVMGRGPNPCYSLIQFTRKWGKAVLTSGINWCNNLFRISIRKALPMPIEHRDLGLMRDVNYGNGRKIKSCDRRGWPR